MKTTRILLVDDHTMITELLAMRLNAEPALQVITTCADAERALKDARLHRPDFIITDIEMPGRSIFDVLTTIRVERPGTRFIFLSAYSSDHYIEEALQLEARAYLTKDESLENLVRGVRRAIAGQPCFSPAIRSRLVLDTGGLVLAPASHSRAQLLTRREKQVLRYVARGLSKREMADLMMISVKTVDNHCSHLMAKLDIHDRVQLTRFAIQEGYARV